MRLFRILFRTDIQFFGFLLYGNQKRLSLPVVLRVQCFQNICVSVE